MQIKNFLTLEDASRDELREILDLARTYEAGHMVPTLAGRTVCLAFFEASTRTAVSFELAARRAGADVISLSEKGSAIQKGESLIDTVVTLDALGADAIVIRHPSAGAARLAARYANAAIVNAGDGCGQHPTQALLDLLRALYALGGFDELAGRKVAVVGDVLHSRVARSVIPAFRAAGMEVSLVAPDTLLPREAGAWGLADTALRGRRPRLGRRSSLHPPAPEGADDLSVPARPVRRRVRSLLRRRQAAPETRRSRNAPRPRQPGRGDLRRRRARRFLPVPDQVAAGIAVRSAVLALAMGAAEKLAA